LIQQETIIFKRIPILIFAFLLIACAGQAAQPAGEASGEGGVEAALFSARRLARLKVVDTLREL
jgi:hypothetical protein